MTPPKDEMILSTPERDCLAALLAIYADNGGLNAFEVSLSTLRDLWPTDHTSDGNIKRGLSKLAARKLLKTEVRRIKMGTGKWRSRTTVYLSGILVEIIRANKNDLHTIVDSIYKLSATAPADRQAAVGSQDPGLDSWVTDLVSSAPSMDQSTKPQRLPVDSHKIRVKYNHHPVPVFGLSSDQILDLLVSSYKRAQEKVFKSKSKLQPSDIAPRFKRLLCNSYELLVIHKLPPFAWAEWFMGNAKDIGRRRPPVITQVFSPKKINSHFEWFRNTYVPPSPFVNADDLRLCQEQIYRNEEAEWRWRTKPGDFELPKHMPDWYRRLRTKEIVSGQFHPFDAYRRL